jgi:hypothetical protein
MPETSRLDYAPSPSWWSRRRAIRTYLLIIAVGAAAFSAWRWGPDALERARFIYFQHRCDRFVGPPDQMPPPQPPDCLKGVFSYAGTPYGQGEDYRYFLVHRLTAKGGLSLLVVVSARLDSGFGHQRKGIPRPPKPLHLLLGECRSLSPASWRDNVGAIAGEVWGINISFGLADQVQVFNGQPDPADISHFTIAYTVDGVPGTLDGWLLDSGVVKLEVRDGPAKPYN